jgi:hypothetical protein
MKKLRRNEKLLVIAASMLLLSILLMFAVIPGILNDTTPGAFPKRAANAAGIQIAVHLALFLAYIKIIRDIRRGNKKRDGAYLAVAVILMFAGLIYMHGAYSYLSHEDMLLVSALKFISVMLDFAAAVMTIMVYALMPGTNKKSRLSGIPAWALSLITLVILFLILMIVDDIESSSLGDADMIGWIIYVIFLTLACYLICSIHPKSVWYTPLICNAAGLIGFIANGIGNLVNANFGTTTLEWIIIVGSIILSFAGALAGRHRNKLRKQLSVDS